MYLVKALPTELNDDILLCMHDIGNFDLAIQYKRFWVAGKLYDDTDFDELSEDVLMKIVHFLSVEKKGVLLPSVAIMGYSGVLAMILSDPRVDPSQNENKAIIWASESCNEVVVKLLLDDNRFQMDVDDHTFKESILSASQYGPFQVFNLFYQRMNSIIDIDTTLNKAIGIASQYGHIEIVKLLLSDPRIDPNADAFNYAITWASTNGYLEIVAMLLLDPRVDPSAENNSAIIWASANGKFDVVELLLSDPRVDPSAQDDQAISMASIYGHDKVVKLLLLHKELK